MGCTLNDLSSKENSAQSQCSFETNHIGRVCVEDLPTEVVLSLFIKNVINPHPSWDEGNPISKWRGVRVDKDELIVIKWHGIGLQGKLNWEYLPPSVEIIDLGVGFNHDVLLASPVEDLREKYVSGTNNLEGEIDFGALPLNLRVLNIRNNRFKGTFKLDALPKKMSFVNMRDNPEIKGDIKKSEFNDFSISTGCRFEYANTQIKFVD